MINRDRLLDTFLELVQTDSPSGEEEAVAQLLVRRLSELGLSAQRDSYGNVIATAGEGQPLMLSAHMDTVEPGRGIKPRMEGDRIVSDGTTVLGGDPKAGVAGILEGLASARETGPLPALEVVLTRQEEIGLVGARNLDYSLIRAREGVVFDGAGPVQRVTNGSPSYLRIDATITGQAAHAGVEPEKGISAIKPLAELVAGLPQGRLDAETTGNIGVVQGGSVRNAVPEHASIQAELRSLNRDTFERLLSDVRDLLAQVKARYSQVQIQETLNIEFEGYLLPEEHPVVQRVMQTLLDLGLEPQVGPSGGGTDANVMRGHGIQAVVVGLGAGDCHTVREYVEPPRLMEVARFCAHLIKAL